MKKILVSLFLLGVQTVVTAQVDKIAYGVVTKELLNQKNHPKYPDAPAAILYKYQKSYVEGSSLSNIRMRTEYFVRFKIYNKKGLDYGTFRIPLREYGYGDFVKSIQGTTLMLENDTIYSNLVGLDHIHNQRIDHSLSILTVTFPNIKVGAVLDIAFTLYSYSPVALPDVFHQFSIPVDRSEADIIVPNYMIFQAYTKGFEDIV